jgi:inner membrane protein
MDIVTHGITGVLVSRAVPSGHKTSVMAAGFIGALAPDLDLIARLWDPMAAIAVHRTATHSFLGGAVIAVVVAGLVWGIRRDSFFHLFGSAYLGLLSHIGSDLLTSFGTAIFWPLTDRRFALAQHYIIDPIFTILALGFLVASFRLKQRRISWANTGLLAIGLYVVIAAAVQRTAFIRWQEFMELQGILPTRSALLPLFPGPFRWLAVSETEKAFYQQSFWLYGSKTEVPHLFLKTNADLGDLERLREVQVFLSFARFPWKQELYDRGRRVIEYRDLAFADHPLGILGGPLSLRIWMDELGSVREMKFGHRF